MPRLARFLDKDAIVSFLQSTRTLVALLDGDGSILDANPAFEALRASHPGTSTFRDAVVPSLKEHAESLLEAAGETKTSVDVLIEFGSEREFLRCQCLILPLARGGFIMFGEPIGEQVHLQAVNERLETELSETRSALASKTVELRSVMAQADELAHTDPLTLLPNRRLILSELQRSVFHARRDGAALTVSMLDLDRFKSVNDDAGHTVGDDVLRQVARELRDHIRKPDQIGRYGGDEFLVILPNSGALAATEQAARLCRRIRSASIRTADREIALTISVGIAQFRPQTDDWQTLLERADRALYEAKRAGGDRWIVLEA
jgi:diguanylate cyclase (GGDEF)-like protein